MRIILFLGLTVATVVLTVVGLYYTSGFWLPQVNAALGSQVEGNKFIVIIPAAVAAIIAALVNGVAAIVSAGTQRKTALEVETRKNEALDELEAKRSENAKSLEAYKNAIATTGAAIEILAEARDLAASYRHQISLLRSGAYSSEETRSLHAKLDVTRDSFHDLKEVYSLWCQFMQWGRLLEDHAKGKRLAGQRRLWLEIIPEAGDRPLGLIFSSSGESLRSAINSEIAKLRTGQVSGKV